MSATAAIEGQVVVKGHATSAPSLSWQQLICCDCGRGDQGCDGGDPHEAYDYIVSAGGLESNTECKSQPRPRKNAAAGPSSHPLDAHASNGWYCSRAVALAAAQTRSPTAAP